MDDYLINHYENCDYCLSVRNDRSLTETKQDELIKNHAMGTVIGRST